MELEKRLARLEIAMQAVRPVEVLVARDGREAVAVADYERRVPEGERSALLVVVRRFTEGAVA